jgi:hypothetical protein
MAFAIEIEQKCETLNSVRWVIFKPVKDQGSRYSSIVVLWKKIYSSSNSPYVATVVRVAKSILLG